MGYTTAKKLIYPYLMDNEIFIKDLEKKRTMKYKKSKSMKMHSSRFRFIIDSWNYYNNYFKIQKTKGIKI